MTGNTNSDMSARQENLGIRILLGCRNELYSIFPNLEGAFSCLDYRPLAKEGTIGTNGSDILFSPPYLLDLYSKNAAALRRGYLHMLLHCLFLHIYQTPQNASGLWDLACDMAVEQVIQSRNQAGLDNRKAGDDSLRIRSWCLQIIGGRARSAQEIAGMLTEGRFPFSQDEMEAAFRFDDHLLWQSSDPSKKKTWEKALAHAGQDKAGRTGRAGTTAGIEEDEITGLKRGPYSYREYLRRFAVPAEEMEIDPDSFDYIFYHLGMDLYGNLPLIEPLEYKDGSKLEELVIAIDTSGSCSKETVARFLSETYGILSGTENFFNRMTVYIIQCDCVVQSIDVIHSPQEWARMGRKIRIRGRGGTDFTPVFRRVEQLRQEGQLKKLRALLYFTDGDGVYPREKTDYETAFVFLNKTDYMKSVPSWAVRLVAGEGVVKS